MLGDFKRVSLSCSIFAYISCIPIGEVSWVKFLHNDHHATSTFCALIDRWCFLVIQFHVCMVCMYIHRMYIMVCTIGTRTSGMRRWLFWQWPLLFYQARVSPPRPLPRCYLAAVLHCCRITLGGSFSLGARPSKNWKGGSGKRGGVEVYTVEC